MRRKVFFLALLTARPIFAQVPVNQGQLEANKKLALDFFKAGIKNPDRMAQYLADDYVQHNPRFVKFGEAHHVSGKQGFVMAIESWILGPTAKQGEPAPPPAPRTPALVVAEGDIVTIIWKQMRPDPDDHSQTYESFAFDTFRIKNGKLAEHWDGATR
jgi:predicted SnoaL-like aldol condensation-catalyzing enzyme